MKTINRIFQKKHSTTKMYSRIIMPLLGIIVLSMTLLSCEKSNLYDQANHIQKSSNQNGISNSLLLTAGFNYDLVGQSHNNYLSYLMANPDFFNLSPEQLYEYGLTYEDPYFVNSDPITFDEMTSAITEVSGLYENLMDNGVLPGNVLVQDSIITEKMKPYVNQLAQLFLEAADTISHEPYTASEFIEHVNSIEEQINTSLSPQVDMADTSANDGAALLCMCSIARFSYSYWYNNYDKWSENLNNSQFITSKKPGTLLRAWRSIKVAAVDVGGFFGAGHGDVHVGGGNGHVSGGGSWSGSITDGIDNAKATSKRERNKYDE